MSNGNRGQRDGQNTKKISLSPSIIQLSSAQSEDLEDFKQATYLKDTLPPQEDIKKLQKYNGSA